MTAEEIRRMEERVAQVRAEMERACRAAGRAPGEVLLCAASKTQNSETVRAAAALDIDLFGENRVQELCEKYAAGAYSGKPLHFIGHLQTNKVRQVVGRACMIESVGSHRLLECVAAEAQKQGIRQDILVEINIGAETSKSGIAPEELPGLLECAHAWPSLRVRGLMSIPPAADAPGASRPYFAQMRGLFERAQAAQGGNVSMEYLSMGMSADFADAILEGANLVRVGTALFGARSYIICIIKGKRHRDIQIPAPFSKFPETDPPSASAPRRAAARRTRTGNVMFGPLPHIHTGIYCQRDGHCYHEHRFEDRIPDSHPALPLRPAHAPAAGYAA